MHVRVVHLIHLYGHNLLQLPDALLHLYGLGGLIAKSLYEGFGVGNLFLLVFISPHLLLAAFLAQHHILVVFHLVIFYMAARNLQGAVGNVVDEGPVMAH